MTECHIDVKEYDPQASEKLAEWSPSEFLGGFRSETETLFKTGMGNYFILCQGGMLSRSRAEDDEGAWYGGTSIRPVTEAEALAWCEETGSYEVIDKHLFFVKLLSGPR